MKLTVEAEREKGGTDKPTEMEALLRAFCIGEKAARVHGETVANDPDLGVAAMEKKGVPAFSW